MKKCILAWLAMLAALVAAAVSSGQTAPSTSQSVEPETIVLTPFEVNAEADQGYVATSTLGGTLIRTNLSDVGSAISVYTKEFLEDLGAFDNQSLLAFTVNTDVGGPQGTFVNANSQGEENENFGNGNSNTRIRGLAAADNTQNYFKSDISWDGYNTDRIDVIRGANSILFGLGSPAGIINASTAKARNSNRGRVQFRFDEHRSARVSLDYNRVLVKDQLAARLALLRNDQKFRQDPAFNDDRRASLTARYTPRWLQRNDSTFKIEVSGEKGETKSNTRRSQPPVDNITPFFLPSSQGGLEGNIVNRLNPADEHWLFLDYGTPQQRANPLVSNAWGNGTVVLVYDGGAQPVDIFEKQIYAANGYRFQNNQAVVNVPNAAGANAGSISGTVQPVFINGYGSVARALNLPFAERYGDRVLTDASVYNFYDHLIDGNSKREMRDWTTLHAEVSHSFFRNKLSYNLQYFTQDMDFDRYAALGSSSTIRIDAGALLPDGRPNPHAGKAFLRESPFTGSRAQTAKRDSWRGLLFFEHDFQRQAGDSRWQRFLGQHFFTGTLSQQNVKQTRFDYMSNGIGPDWVQNRLINSNAVLHDQFNTAARTLNYFYISDNLAGRQVGADLGLRNIGPGTPPVTGSYNYRYFDADYRRFNPAVNPIAVDPEYGRALQNPANYAGWTTGPITLYGAPTDRVSRDYLTRVRDFFKERVDSKALVWQGKFFRNAVVGTYGWREDEYSSWLYSWDEQRSNLSDFDPSLANYNFAPIRKVGQARNWSVALHAEKVLPRLPFNVSLLYGKGENTNPDPVRIGVFRDPVLSARGETTDQSVVISTKDNKWILRATKYETAVRNASSNSTLQSQKFLIEQAFWQVGFQGVYRTLPPAEGGEGLEYYGRPADALVAREQAGTITPAEADRLALQRANVATNITAARAWLDFERRFAERFPDATAAWTPTGGTFPGSINTPGMRWSYPENAVLLEDNASKGWEMELVANVTKSWRISGNVSKTKAIRDNLPGKRFEEVMDFVWAEFQGPVGRVVGNTSAALNGAPSVNNTPRERLSGLWDAYQVQLQNNGQSVQELSEWRFNFVTNYRFESGFLKGFSLGGSYRYESPKTIGYGYRITPEGTIGVDLNTRYENEAYHNVGLTLRYGRKLRDRVTWSIQANVYNAFQGDKVLATSTQPDGSILRGMIREGQTWAVTNTFEF